MRSRLLDQGGQTAAEYLGVLLVVATIVASLVTLGFGEQVARLVADQVCRISGGQGCGGGSSAAGARAGSDPAARDSDRDGIRDAEERRLGTDPRNGDSDADGLPDREERDSGKKVSPTDPDSDDDGLADGEEVAVGTDPSDDDSDGALGAPGDGLSDAREIELGTGPNVYDTDGDFYADGYEVEHGMDPLKDERTPLEKVRDALLDDPIGAALPGGGAGKGAKKVIDDLLKGSRKVPSAKSVREAADIRRERLEQLRERLRKAKERLADERGSVELPGRKPKRPADREGDGAPRPPAGTPGTPPRRLNAFPAAQRASRKTPSRAAADCGPAGETPGRSGSTSTAVNMTAWTSTTSAGVTSASSATARASRPAQRIRRGGSTRDPRRRAERGRPERRARRARRTRWPVPDPRPPAGAPRAGPRGGR